MPRSKARPIISTYHEAVSFIISAVDDSLELPLTKNQDKFTANSLCYLAGMFGLDINAKIQEIDDHIQVTYNVPVEFITWVRVMQQETRGVEVPKFYGPFSDNWAKVEQVLEEIKKTDRRDHWQDHDRYQDEVNCNFDIEDNLLEEEELDQANYRLEAITPDDMADQVSNVIAATVITHKPDWDTLAAANPLAAQFVQSLMSTPDFEEEEEVFDHHGTWEYPDTEDYEDDTDDDYEFDYTYHDEE